MFVNSLLLVRLQGIGVGSPPQSAQTALEIEVSKAVCRLVDRMVTAPQVAHAVSMALGQGRKGRMPLPSCLGPKAKEQSPSGDVACPSANPSPLSWLTNIPL